MLVDELASRSYSKAEHNRQLQQLLPSRSRGAIEFKHQNISAVMLGLGHPWIDGYKPASQFQTSLIDAVLRWLNINPQWIAVDQPRGIESAPSGMREEIDLWIGPPPTFSNEPSPVEPERMAAIARKHDVAARDARNRALGKSGEERIYLHEKTSLKNANRADLSEKVRWTAIEDGDGAGYDIHSYEPDGRDRFIEVKTTNGWQRTPFHLTRNELSVAEANRDTWHLIRLWDFAREPKAFSIRPPLEGHVELTPTSFLAYLR